MTLLRIGRPCVAAHQAGIVGGQIGIGPVVEAEGPLITEMRVACEEGRHSSPHLEPVVPPGLPRSEPAAELFHRDRDPPAR